MEEVKEENPIEEPHPEEEMGDGGLNFNNLLFKLNQVEMGQVSVSHEEHDKLIELVQKKVDGIQAKLMDWKYECLKDAEYIEMFTKRKQVNANKMKRLGEWALFCLENNKMPKLIGQMFQVAIKTTVKCETFDDPDQKKFIQFKKKYPGIINQKFSWDKNLLKAELKKDSASDLKSFARLVENHRASFTTIKEKRKEKK